MKFSTLIISGKFGDSIVYIPDQQQMKFCCIEECNLVLCSWICVQPQGSFSAWECRLNFPQNSKRLHISQDFNLEVDWNKENSFKMHSI